MTLLKQINQYVLSLSQPAQSLKLELQVKARIASGLTQGQLAERMHTSQTAIARLESGKELPSMKTLAKFALATNSRVLIQ